MDADEARRRLQTLASTLRKVIERDHEQEVRGIAVPVVDAVISASRDLLQPEDRVGSVMRDLITPEAIADGNEPLRAVDALIVVEQLIHSIPETPFDFESHSDPVVRRSDFDL